MTQKFNLTPTNIEALRSDNLSDPRTPGLYMRGSLTTMARHLAGQILREGSKVRYPLSAELMRNPLQTEEGVPVQRPQSGSASIFP